MQKSKNTYKANYITGFGVGTLVSPLLFSALDVTMPSKPRWIVWGLGLAIIILSYVWDVLKAKSASK